MCVCVCLCVCGDVELRPGEASLHLKEGSDPRANTLVPAQKKDHKVGVARNHGDDTSPPS